MKYLCLLLCCMVMAACSTQKTDSKLVMGTEATFPPYMSVNAKGELEGFDVDVAQALGQKLGKEIVFKDLGFDALILALKKGKVDGIIGGISISPSRLKEIAMLPYQGDPVTSYSLLSWKKKGDPSGLTVVQAGTIQEAYLLEKGMPTKSLPGNGVDLVMELKYGKADNALIEPKVAAPLVARFDELQEEPILLAEEDWVLGNGIGIRKENTALIEAISVALEELKAEGRLDELNQKWFGS